MITLAERSNIYFASDLHLGMQPAEESLRREKLFIEWLEEIRRDARELWLLGDVFDYWFEYKRVVPRGYTRFLGKLSELADKGIKVHIFSGNHDVWLFDYLSEEVGADIHHHPLITKFGDKTFYLSHGDGLTKRDKGYLILKSIFRSRFLQWCYARIHPNGATAFAQWWSRTSRYNKGFSHPYKGDDKEEQVVFARNFLNESPEIDYFLFGHRHLAFDVNIAKEKRVICLGDWIGNFSFAMFDGKEINLKKFEADPPV